MRHAPDGLAVIDADARFVDANPAAVLLCGLDPDAVAGAPSPFPAPDDAAGARAGELTVAWEPAPASGASSPTSSPRFPGGAGGSSPSAT